MNPLHSLWTHSLALVFTVLKWIVFALFGWIASHCWILSKIVGSFNTSFEKESLQLRLINFWRIMASLFTTRNSTLMLLWTCIQLWNSSNGTKRANPFQRKENTNIPSQKSWINLLVSTNICFKIQLIRAHILDFSKLLSLIKGSPLNQFVKGTSSLHVRSVNEPSI